VSDPSAVIPFEAEYVWICSNCADKGRQFIQQIDECCWCGKPLHPTSQPQTDEQILFIEALLKHSEEMKVCLRARRPTTLKGHPIKKGHYIFATFGTADKRRIEKRLKEAKGEGQYLWCIDLPPHVQVANDAEPKHRIFWSPDRVHFAHSDWIERQATTIVGPDGNQIESKENGRSETATQSPSTRIVRHKVKASADTTELALEEARRSVPVDAQVLFEKEVTKPRTKVVTVEAFDEETARIAARGQVRMSGPIVREVQLVKSGKQGFLGIGKTPHQYKVTVLRQAVVRITYQELVPVKRKAKTTKPKTSKLEIAVFLMAPVGYVSANRQAVDHALRNIGLRLDMFELANRADAGREYYAIYRGERQARALGRKWSEEDARRFEREFNESARPAQIQVSIWNLE